MSTHTTNLLRRTFVLLGAAAALVAGTQAIAQGTVTLSGTNSNTCNYSQMTVTPNGNITVSCGSGGTTNPSQASFTLSHASSSSGYVLTPNTSSAATVARSGGPAEAVMVTYSVSGSGCSSGSGGIQMNAGQSQTIAFSVGAAGTSCVITISVPTGHNVSGSNQITFTAQTGGGGGGGGTAPPDCPAIPSSAVAGNTVINDFVSVDQRRGSPASGQILYYPVPTSNTASVKVTFDQGQTGWSPAAIGDKSEFQVSPCPGVWDPPGHSIANQCRYQVAGSPNAVFTIWTAAAVSSQGTTVTSQDNLQYLCWAPIQNRTYYINVRWTYSCPQEIINGYGGCGFSIKWRSNNSNGLFD